MVWWVIGPVHCGVCRPTLLRRNTIFLSFPVHSDATIVGMDVSLIEQLTLDCICRNHLIPNNSTVLLAVSGGSDSTAMVRLLDSFCRQGRIRAKLIIAHINHNLRACAQKDQDFVEKLAFKLNIHFFCESVDVSGHAKQHRLSTETAARDLRRQALIRIAKRQNCNNVALAHHADDNAETLIFRLKRGTAYPGLAGIAPKKKFDNVFFIRPMLMLRSCDIQSYLRTIGQDYCTDPTNRDTAISRNLIRHQLLPAIQQDCNKDITAALARLAESTRRMQLRIEKETDHWFEEIVNCKKTGFLKLDKKRFAILPEPIQANLLRKGLIELNAGQRDLTRRHYKRMLSFAGGPGNRILELPGGFILKTNRKSFYLADKSHFRSKNNESGTL